MKIQIYGSGCRKCEQLMLNAETAAKKLGIQAEIEKITEMNAIVSAGVLMTPALGIEGKLAASGRVLSAGEIEALLRRC